MTLSRPSTPALSIHIPRPDNFQSEFVYNYYVYDEATNASAGVPEYLKKKSSEQINTETSNFMLRQPRYIKLTWNCSNSSKALQTDSSKFPIKDNLEKVASEDGFVSSRFTSHTFSDFEKIENAYKDINTSSDGKTSQATIIDNYVSSLLKRYSETGDESDLSLLRNQITKAVENIEIIADRPSSTLGINFYNADGKQIMNSGFDRLISNVPVMNVSINSLVLSDVFVSASLSQSDIDQINSEYQKSKNESSRNEDAIVKPIYVGEKTRDPESFLCKVSLVGYVIDKHEMTDEGFIKTKTITIESSFINSFIDLEVKYGSTYYYSIRAIAKIEIPGYDEENAEIRDLIYYVSSGQISNSTLCKEVVPPPPPVDTNFVWDYKTKKIKIVWGMPVNSQRDIKQFQIFRRSSIREPFELIRQKCFDYSTKKYLTGELIDGNRVEMTKEEESFVDYEKFPSMSYVDDDFFVDIEMLSSSKYIYTVATVDAHGMISNYGAQFEVTFDFFKNKIVKKLISSSGAPRQYPNMQLELDTFKDVIKTSGEFSSRMKLYFMPEYFKIKYNNSREQTLVSTNQQNSFYKIQFINLQNQKSDSIKVKIDDPYGLVK